MRYKVAGEDGTGNNNVMEATCINNVYEAWSSELDEDHIGHTGSNT